MSKFDTHGGYFAPKDYLKVNEGGSHEENPNGGVQIGVDPEGNPNLLEEGEPVYKDYVYSDNITAEKEFLEQNHLPGKYDGKLYSKIADDILSEAEERPLDPISRNGLEALLGRLAEAQEGQKQRDQQRELEDELANLSPEELDQLEAMLAQEQPVGEDNPMYGEGPVGALGEPGISPGPVQPPMEMPMMRCGGTLLKRFDVGGNMDEPDRKAIIDAAAKEAARLGPKLDGEPVHVPSLLELTLGSDNKIVQGINSVRDAYDDWRNNSTIGGIVDALIPRDATQAFAPLSRIGKVGKAAYSAADIETQVAKWSSEYNAAQKAYDAARKVVKTGKDAAGNAVASDVAKAGLEQAKKALNLAKGEFRRWSGMSGMSSATAKTASSAASATEQAAKPVEAATETAVEDAPSLWKALANPLYGAGKQTAKALSGKSGLVRYPAVAAAQLGQWGSGYAMYGGVDKALDTWKSPFTGEPSYEGDEQPELDFGDWEYARGGKLNKFDGGGWADFLQRLADYKYSLNRANVDGKYAIDRRSDVWGNRTARDIEADKAYQDFTNYVLTNSDNPEVRKYLHALDNGVAEGVPLLFNGDELVSGWEDLFRHRRTDGDLGIYHLNPEDIGFLTAPAVPAATAQNPQIDELSPRMAYAMSIGNQTVPVDYAEELSPRMAYAMGLTAPESSSASSPSTPVSSKKVDIQSAVNLGYAPLPTWSRYAGAIGSGLLGLYNVFQSPDKYRQRQLQPYLPEGRIHLQNQVYNPIDQNMVANSIIAQGNATNRSLRNSGLGPSTGAAILASDNNTTGNLGTGFIQAWDANNQRRNAVIAANNQAEAQRANFDWTVDAARKKILNDTAYINGYNDLNVQRLNYGAEGDKYTAISNQIANGLQALSGIGKENFAMNQVNSNRAFLGYGTSPNGWMLYNPDYLEYLKNKEKGK